MYWRNKLCCRLTQWITVSVLYLLHIRSEINIWLFFCSLKLLRFQVLPFGVDRRRKSCTSEVHVHSRRSDVHVINQSSLFYYRLRRMHSDNHSKKTINYKFKLSRVFLWKKSVHMYNSLPILTEYHGLMFWNRSSIGYRARNKFTKSM